MRVKIKSAEPSYWYANKVGEIIEVMETHAGDAIYSVKGEGYKHIKKSDCTIIPEETENRVPFNYEVWKEKGGKVWYGTAEVTQLTKFDLDSKYEYVGVYSINSLGVFSSEQLTMFAPDRVVYVVVLPVHLMTFGSIEECKRYAEDTNAIHILEINITKGTNKIVHTYNEKV